MLTLEQARLWYPTDDNVHGFDHIVRVVGMCEIIGPQEEAEMRIVRAAALLHDARGSHPGKGQRENHHIESADFAGDVLNKDGWSDNAIRAVQHCILTHRFRENHPPETIEAKVLFDADKLDVIGAVGVVRALAYANQAKQPAYARPSAQFLRTGKKIAGEAHSAYHEYIYKLKNISSLLFTDSARQIAHNRQAFLDAFFDELKEEIENLEPRKE